MVGESNFHPENFIWFCKPKLDKDFASYYDEFKQSKEYKEFKEKQLAKINKNK